MLLISLPRREARLDDLRDLEEPLDDIFPVAAPYPLTRVEAGVSVSEREHTLQVEGAHVGQDGRVGQQAGFVVDEFGHPRVAEGVGVVVGALADQAFRVEGEPAARGLPDVVVMDVTM